MDRQPKATESVYNLLFFFVFEWGSTENAKNGLTTSFNLKVNLNCFFLYLRGNNGCYIIVSLFFQNDGSSMTLAKSCFKI